MKNIAYSNVQNDLMEMISKLKKRINETGF